MPEEAAARRANAWNTLIFCAFAALLLAVCALLLQHAYSPRKWNSDRENRYKIVNSLLNRHPLVGMSEAEVLALLGPEDGDQQTSFKISRRYFPPESTLVYYLGVDLIDVNWLVISLEDGVVTEYCIDVT